MEFLDTDRWRLPHCSKIDQLVEPDHTHLIIHFLGDRDTNVDKLKDGSFVLYGKQEAVLVIPSRPTTVLTLELIYLIKTFFHSLSPEL